MESFKKFLKIFQDVEFVLAIIILVLAIVPRLFGIIPYAVKTGSMEPTIRTGSIAFVNTKADVNDIKTDDVIAFKISDEMLVTHRVYEVNSNYFITKGDANDVPDSKWVYHNDVIGTVVLSIPLLGTASLMLKGVGAKIVIGVFILFNIAISIIIGYKPKTERKEICDE